MNSNDFNCKTHKKHFGLYFGSNTPLCNNKNGQVKYMCMLNIGNTFEIHIAVEINYISG